MKKSECPLHNSSEDNPVYFDDTDKAKMFIGYGDQIYFIAEIAGHTYALAQIISYCPLCGYSISGPNKAPDKSLMKKCFIHFGASLTNGFSWSQFRDSVRVTRNRLNENEFLFQISTPKGTFNFQKEIFYCPMCAIELKKVV